MDAISHFRSQIEAFLEKTGMAPSAFGREAVGDASFVSDVREGRGPGLRTAQKVLDYMASYRHRKSKRN